MPDQLVSADPRCQRAVLSAKSLLCIGHRPIVLVLAWAPMNLHLAACVNLLWHAKHAALRKQASGSSWCSKVEGHASAALSRQPPGASCCQPRWLLAMCEEARSFGHVDTRMSAGTQAQLFQLG